MTDITTRKDQHVDIVLAGDVHARTTTHGFERITFAHVAMPELHLDQIDVTTKFLGRNLTAPFLISSMTGGPSRSEAINRHIAEAAQHLRIAFGVGSQRVALEEQGAAGLGTALRSAAPDVPILANIGAAQLRTAHGLELARRAVDMIEADAVIIHLNPLQEAVQEGGDRDWTGVLQALARLVTASAVPVVVKEVGFGISGSQARRLFEIGIDIIDVAGAGGTSWAAVEAKRSTSPTNRAVAEAFRDWGIPTAHCIVDVRKACPTATIIASGGIKTGLDAAKAIRLGGSIVGQAAPALAAAVSGPSAIVEHFEVLREQLRIACFCTGSKNLKGLGHAELVV